MTSDQARQRAERNFKREERAQDGRKAMIEYEAQAVATRKKTARLKALRLAKEAQARNEPLPEKPVESSAQAPTEIALIFRARHSRTSSRVRGSSPLDQVCDYLIVRT